MTTASKKPSDWGPCLPKMVFAPLSVIVAMIAVSLLQNEVGAQTSMSAPDFQGQVMLIRNTIVAVNHGNITGNYTVLRDLGSDRFRRQNKAADLATTFANLRKQKFDLSPILMAEPQLTQKPAEDKFRGRLQLVGYFPTRPQAVRFALIFQHIRGSWVIDEITVGVVPIESVVRTQHSRLSLPPLQSHYRSGDIFRDNRIRPVAEGVSF